MFLSLTPFDPLRKAIMKSIFKVPLFGDLFSRTRNSLGGLIRDVFLQQLRRDELLNNRIEISNRHLNDIADVD